MEIGGYSLLENIFTIGEIVGKYQPPPSSPLLRMKSHITIMLYRYHSC